MRIPNLPENVSLSNIASEHALIRELSETPEGKRFANALFRLISMTNVSGGRINTIGRGFSAVLLNAISDADGFNPWHLKMDVLTAALMNPKTNKQRHRTISLIGLSHPDKIQSVSVYNIIKAQDKYPAKELEKMVEEAHAARSQRRSLGVDDQVLLDTIEAQAGKRPDAVTRVPKEAKAQDKK